MPTRSLNLTECFLDPGPGLSRGIISWYNAGWCPMRSDWVTKKESPGQSERGVQGHTWAEAERITSVPMWFYLGLLRWVAEPLRSLLVASFLEDLHWHDLVLHEGKGASSTPCKQPPTWRSRLSGMWSDPGSLELQAVTMTMKCKKSCIRYQRSISSIKKGKQFWY